MSRKWYCLVIAFGAAAVWAAAGPGRAASPDGRRGSSVPVQPASFSVSTPYRVATYTSPSAVAALMSREVGNEHFTEARQLFRQARYDNALRVARQAAAAMPQDAKTHELIALALFALGDYRTAAREAHVALALGPPGDWAGIYGYYSDADRYIAQFRLLEQFVRANPRDVDARFLLGYHDVMLDRPNAAREQLLQVMQFSQGDTLPGELLDLVDSRQAAAAEVVSTLP